MHLYEYDTFAVHNGARRTMMVLVVEDEKVELSIGACPAL